MIIIDADSIVYRVGFPADGKSNLVVGYDEEGHPVAQETFGKVKEAREFGETFADYDLEPVLRPDTKANVLHSVKVAMNDIITACRAYGEDRIVYLSGPGNFRADLATLRVYKGNRSQEAPYHYFNIRHYLTEDWNASVVEGREADDQCCIKALEMQRLGEPYVVVSIDKDLDMIPGLHYNYVRKTFYTMTPLEGTKHFYKQLLMGDNTDNIPGCYKVGKSNKLLDEIEGCHTEQQMWDIAVEAYTNAREKKGYPYGSLPIRDIMIENARLLWMQEEPGQLWTPPGEAWEYMESFE